MSLPARYQWLANEGAPKMIVEFLGFYGIKETIGNEDNPIILAWAKELGLKEYLHDSTAWCGLFIAIVAKRAGKEVVLNPLWAANWLNFGTAVDEAMLGDVLVFKRTGGNHVGLYIGEDSLCYHVGGGNQSDSVSITRIDKARCRGIRRPKYNNPPANIRKIILSATGEISSNES